jgi:DNA-binding response OmpR family regulator
MLSAHILSIDDEKLIRDLLVEYLGMSGYHVEGIGDPHQALKSVESDDYDLLLLDMKMPGMTGKDFFTALSSSKPEMTSRIVFITGDIVTHETRAFLEGTGRPAVEKPFDLAEVKRIVAEELSANTQQKP